MVDEKLNALKSITTFSFDFMLPINNIMQIDDKPILDKIRSSEVTCKINVVNADDVGSKITYIPWHERYKLCDPLQDYFYYLWGEDTPELLILQSVRVLDMILNDINMTRGSYEVYRSYVFDIYDKVRQEEESK